MWKISAVVLVGIVWSIESAGAFGSNASDNGDQKAAIYKASLEGASKATEVAFREHTANPDVLDLIDRDKLECGPHDKVNEALSDYESNRGAVTSVRETCARLRVRCVADQNVDEVLSDSAKDEEEASRGVHGVRCITGISEIGFGDKGRKAVVFLSRYCANECGDVRMVVLHKSDSSWMVDCAIVIVEY